MGRDVALQGLLNSLKAQQRTHSKQDAFGASLSKRECPPVPTEALAANARDTPLASDLRR